jgi:riboflavin kinase/FMN adenylyltransferase
MELIRGPVNLRERHRGCVITIGSFDGIHVGHQALLTRLCEHGARLSRPTMLLTFEPMPREYLMPERPPARLTSWRERWHILSGLGIDYMTVLRFNERLRNLSGQDFESLLANQLRSRVVVVGHDFRFGHKGEATGSVLKEAGKVLGFDVDVVPPVLLGGVRVSSSGIREALSRGDFDLARSWLGRPYSMTGRVVRGNQLGRKLGFPTANLRTVDGGGEMLLEAHVFDFAADLYGREIAVEFVSKLRDEEHFANLDALVEQMNTDAVNARRILS